MQTSYIPNTLLRAAVNENQLLIFDDVNDQILLRVNEINPSHEELSARGMHSPEEFHRLVILPLVAEELQIDLVKLPPLVN